ncbi:MAG: hypothetical protein ACFFD4_07680 [Candidatus Odinarchaeota archaeon]
MTAENSTLDQEVKESVLKRLFGMLKKTEEADQNAIESIIKENQTLTSENTDLKDKLDKTEARVDELEKADRERGLDEIAKSMAGDVEKNKAYLIKMAEKLSKEDFDAMVEREKTLAKQLTDAGIFGEAGKNAPGSGSAYEELEKKAKEKIAKGMSSEKAWDEAIRENPELYKEYTEEKTKPIKD